MTDDASEAAPRHITRRSGGGAVNLVRSGLALAAGFLVVNVLITLWAFVAVMALWPELAPRPDGTFVFPPPDHPAFKLEMLVNVPVSILAAYVCARVARRREVAHVAALAAVLLALSVAYATGGAGAEFGAAKPMWAHLGTAIGLMVGCVVGTRLRLRQKARRGA